MSHSQYLVVGLGKTGLSIARYLARSNKSFILFDTRAEPPGLAEFKAEFPDVMVYLQTVPSSIVQTLTDIITSPGVPLDLPLLIHAKAQGVQIYGDIECLAREVTAPVIAITGTNGKSTVTELVGEMAKEAGFKVAVAGNIGAPVLDVLNSGPEFDLWVLELSSFQLDLTESLAPVAATILNVTKDHLDRHHTMEAYIQAKQRIYRNAKLCLYNCEDEQTYPKEHQDGAVAISFGQDKPLLNQWGLQSDDDGVYLAFGDKKLLSTDKLRIKGIHNWLNALAACALAKSVGIDTAVMCRVLTEFSGLQHRCQWVQTLNQVDWINDSKGTNTGATISAIKGIGGAMQGKIVLIVGGQGKGADFTELAPSVSAFVRFLVLIGEDADKIEQALAHQVPMQHADSMEHAITIAHNEAKPGDVVLLSPACASFDMFRDFNHRGEVFSALAKRLDS